MVRNLVGFVADVARGVRSLEDIPVLLFKEEPKEDSSQGNDGKLASMVKVLQHVAFAWPGFSRCKIIFYE